MNDDEIALLDAISARALAGDGKASAILDRLGEEFMNEWLAAREAQARRQLKAEEEVAAREAVMHGKHGLSRIKAILGVTAD